MPLRAHHSPDVVVEDLDDDVCLYRPDIDEVVVLNATAGDVWRLADGQLSMDEVIQRLASAYQLSVESVRGDVESVFIDLLDRGYLVDAGDRPA
ncbi:MAG: PqqD family protein [Jatrophihabitans sp.]